MTEHLYKMLIVISIFVVPLFLMIAPLWLTDMIKGDGPYFVTEQTQR